MIRSAPESSSPAWASRCSWSETCSPDEGVEVRPLVLAAAAADARPGRARSRGRASRRRRCPGGDPRVWSMSSGAPRRRRSSTSRQRPRRASAAAARARASAGRLGARRAAAFEQRILLDLLGDEALDLEIGRAPAAGSPAGAAASSPATGFAAGRGGDRGPWRCLATAAARPEPVEGPASLQQSGRPGFDRSASGCGAQHAYSSKLSPR